MFDNDDDTPPKSYEIDYFGSAEFEITEGLKDLVHHIKLLRHDVDVIKDYLHLKS